jgi:zinc protease
MTRRALLALAASAVAADRKNRAPVSREALKVKLPEATPVKLSNGVTVLAMEDNRLPLVWIRVQVDGAGKVYEPHPGLAELTAQMLIEGSKDRSGKQILEEAAQLGAALSTGTISNRETATLEGSGLSGQFDRWLALAAEVLMHPTFPVDEFNGIRQRWLVDLRMRSAQANALAQDALGRLTYGTHPGSLADPPPAALAEITPEMLASWHRERYAPSSTVFTVIGRVRQPSVVSDLERLLAGWNTPSPKFSLPPPPLAPSRRRIVLIDRAGAPQTRLAIGGLLFERSDPDFFPMVVLHTVLGGGGNSRLARLLEGTGRALNATSTYGTARFTGFWQVRADVRTEATSDALTTVLSQLRRLCEELVPTAELDEAKSSVVGRFALDLEQPSAVINYSYQRYRYGFSADYWERYPAKINAVTANEVQAVAQRYFNPDHAHIVAVGDAARIRGVLAKLGPVEA